MFLYNIVQNRLIPGPISYSNTHVGRGRTRLY